MQRWEYQKIVMKIDDLTATMQIPGDAVMGRLRLLGNEGWELVSILKETKMADAKMKIEIHTYTLYLKRPISN